MFRLTDATTCPYIFLTMMKLHRASTEFGFSEMMVSIQRTIVLL